jgi:excinuclease ABC subunit C
MVVMRDKKDLLKKTINTIPAATGVYLMRDERREIVYVGKSKNLKTRVRSYFAGKDTRAMIPFLLSRVHSIDVIVTENEKEALILENELIKRHRPRYNVTLRDDKTYFSIRVDLGEPFPRFQLVRRVRKDGAVYFGPYTSSGAVKETLHYLQKVFPLRTCKNSELKNRVRPCMEQEIKRCLAPCCRLVSEQDYKTMVREAVLFMRGRGTRLLSELKTRMQSASDVMDFEEAAALRDRIRAIEVTLEKQTTVSRSMRDRDVFGLYREGEEVQVCLLYVRNGTITGKKDFPLFRTGAGSDEVVSSVVKQYYDREVSIPREIVISVEVEDRSVIEEWLSEKGKGRRISVIIPRKGERKQLLAMAESNAKTACLAEKASSHEAEETLRLMRGRLHLQAMPRRIECFDISNIGGRSAVGSMVAFTDGRPDTSRYRRFRIKTVDGADDYAMMSEVLRRRYRNKRDIPDLIVVDGGKGQLSVARSALIDLDILEVDIIAIAKEARFLLRSADGGETRKEDRVYIPHRKNPISLTGSPSVLFLLQRIRDEAHRFAVTYHRRHRDKREFRSMVEEIPGIGGTRKKELLRYFGDVKKIRDATMEELAAVPKIGRETARRIVAFFDAEKSHDT